MSPADSVRKLEPPAYIEQSLVPVAEDRRVLILEANVAPSAPYAYDGRPYKRIGPTTSVMPQTEYNQRLLVRTHELHRWENQLADGYRLEDLDLSEVERTHRMAVDVRRLDAPFTSAADLRNPPAKRTLQDDLSLLRSLGLIETSGRGAGSRWWLKQSQE